MRFTLIGSLLTLGLLVAVAACSPLRTFNTVIPKDDGSITAARGIAYGEGPRRKLDIYLPTGPIRQHPVIIFFYGGSWNSGLREGYGFAGRALAAAGFVVVVPDYRVVPEVYFPGFLSDCADAVRWTRANIARYGGDPDRVVLAGHSAGAYNAAMLALDPQWLGRDRAAIKGLIGLAGPYDFLPLDGPVPIKTFSQWPRLEETQPITYAKAGDPPAFLAAGDQDTLVLPRNSIALQKKLAAAGVDTELKLYPELGHVGIVTSLAKPFRGRAPVLNDAIAFARRVTAE